MVFSSSTFLFAFLPAVLVLTWIAPARLRRWILLAASFLFYAWGAQAFVLVVIASTLVDWALALGIARALAANAHGRARALLLAGVAQNLGLLATYKYAGFATTQADQLAQFFGMNGPGTFELLLPIGISFFTFEKLSYLIDVRRGDVQARRDPFDLLLFVALFPRSIAGPIVRMREIGADLHRPTPTVDLMQAGATRFAHGLAKKILIADQLGPIADAAFASAEAGTLTMAGAWLGALAYALQLYFDFSGYSDMAIGIGMMLGFRFPENFNRPYSAVSMTDFWRRWHMTLTRWFRDYVYIPLGGSRGSARRTGRNLVLVFALTGLWHGADWAFLLWGLYHGGWLLLERRRGWRAVDGPVSHAWLRRASTFLIVLIGWVLFRAGSLDLAVDYYGAMVSPSAGLPYAMSVVTTPLALLALAVGCLVLFLPRDRSGGVALVSGVGRGIAALRVATLVIVLPAALTVALASSSSPFLYFQF